MEASINKRIQYFPKGSYLLSVCKSSSSEITGNVFFPAAEKTYSFTTAWDLLKQIDDDITFNHFPQKAFELRKWGKNRARQIKMKETQMDDPVKIEAYDCHFLIHVQYCQSATWQGSIQWLEGKQTRSFRSQFELLKLIEEALNC